MPALCIKWNKTALHVEGSISRFASKLEIDSINNITNLPTSNKVKSFAVLILALQVIVSKAPQ